MASNNNPLAAPGDDFTSTIHTDPYPAIDPAKADLTGKAVLLLGASRGIGASIATSFAKSGASQIAIGARSDLSNIEAQMLAAAKELNRPAPQILRLKIDMTSQASLEAAAQKVEQAFGRLDILINNAGILGKQKILDSDPDEWWQIWNVNVRGPYLATRAFLPLLLRTEDGSKTIVNTGSVGAWIAGPGLSAYQNSKLAVLRFADFVNAEYGEQGVLCYTVHPGNVLTDIVGGENVDPKLRHLFVDKPELCGDSLVYLTGEKRMWLAGRYVSCTWDLPEVMGREEEIVKGGKLKIGMML